MMSSEIIVVLILIAIAIAFILWVRMQDGEAGSEPEDRKASPSYDE
jgi:hypothetical protein